MAQGYRTYIYSKCEVFQDKTNENTRALDKTLLFILKSWISRQNSTSFLWTPSINIIWDWYLWSSAALYVFCLSRIQTRSMEVRVMGRVLWTRLSYVHIFICQFARILAKEDLDWKFPPIRVTVHVAVNRFNHSTQGINILCTRYIKLQVNTSDSILGT